MVVKMKLNYEVSVSTFLFLVFPQRQSIKSNRFTMFSLVNVVLFLSLPFLISSQPAGENKFLMSQKQTTSDNQFLIIK